MTTTPTPMNQYIDAQGLGYHINLISALGGTSDPNAAPVIRALTDASNNISNAGPQINSALTRQNDVVNILNNETARLNSKKDSINNAIQGQNRIIALNESYRARYADYVNIIIIFTTCIFIVIALSILSNAYPIIPVSIVTIISIIVILIGLYMGYLKYLDITSRDMINYNELNIPPPVKLSPAQLAAKKQSAEKGGDLLGGMNIGTCVGQLCCAEGTLWDTNTSTCIIPTTTTPTPVVQSFTTINQENFSGSIALRPETIAGNSMISPNSPNEFSQYSIV
jgi:hypothetical protein